MILVTMGRNGGRKEQLFTIAGITSQSSRPKVVNFLRANNLPATAIHAKVVAISAKIVT